MEESTGGRREACTRGIPNHRSNVALDQALVFAQQEARISHLPTPKCPLVATCFTENRNHALSIALFELKFAHAN